MTSLRDLPQFTVSAVEDLGRDSVRLRGHFDRTEGIREAPWDYLYRPAAWMTATVASVTPREYVVEKAAADRIEIVPGMTFAWLSSYWNPSVLDCILDPKHRVEKLVFAASDAFAYDGGRVWEKAREKPSRPNPSVVKGGWDHEHCDICMEHIDQGNDYFADEARKLFFCIACFEKYVQPQDLSFVLS